MAKLVVILARRLLAWPEMAVIAVQDADGELKFSEDSSAHIDLPEKVWIRGGVLGFREDGRIGEVADDYRTAIVTRAEWQAAVDALKPDAQRFAEDYVEANKDRHVKEWDGVGLPPVGTVCEWAGCTYAPEDPKEPDLHIGDQVTIIAHFKDGELDLAAFIFNPQIHNHNRGTASVNQGAHGCFRPIRTPEQIAAEERRAGIEEMREILHGGRGTDWATYLYDAGYRKQEPK